MQSIGSVDKSKLIIATAGAGKTSYLIDRANEIKSDNVLIVTYTEANEHEIKSKFIKKYHFIPKNVVIQGWFSFLLKHGVRPYQGAMHNQLYEQNIGFYLVNERSGKKINQDGTPILGQDPMTKNFFPLFWGESDMLRYYFTPNFHIYSDKISQFIINCNTKVRNEVIERISRIYPYIFIDEVQDLAGWELDILAGLLQTSSKIVMVGDFRQITYLTHHPKKNLVKRDGRKHYLTIEEFINKNKLNDVCPTEPNLLKESHRNNRSICDFSSSLFPEYPKSEPCSCEMCRHYEIDHEGVFLVQTPDVNEYIRKIQPSPIILKWEEAINPDWNFGSSKGKTFERVLIYPTVSIKKWLVNRKVNLTDITRCKFYVALTRAKYSVGIVFDYDEAKSYVGLQKWKPS